MLSPSHSLQPWSRELHRKIIHSNVFSFLFCICVLFAVWQLAQMCAWLLLRAHVLTRYLPDVLMIVAMATSFWSERKTSRVRAGRGKRGGLVNSVAGREIYFSWGSYHNGCKLKDKIIFWLKVSDLSQTTGIVNQQNSLGVAHCVLFLYVSVFMCGEVWHVCRVWIANYFSVCLCSALMFLQMVYDLKEA